jgi:glucose/mannose-6-phosphate isomerase
MGEPRSAAGYVFMCLLSLCHRLGIAPAETGDVDSALKALRIVCEQLRVEVPLPSNPAKQLAVAFANRIPVICSGGIFGAVARRWKNQVNENAKQWAAVELLPELMHNSIEGYGSPAVFKLSASVLILQPSLMSDSLAVRFQLLRDTLEARQIQNRQVIGQGTSPLAQILAAIALGDSFSFYLGVLNGKDPATTHTIQSAKERLKNRADSGELGGVGFSAPS